MAQSRDAVLPRFSQFKPDSFRGSAGFFRVAQTKSGQWWFIDPFDQSFFSKGVACVSRSGRPNGRSLSPSRYLQTVDTLYGASPDAFVRSVIQRLRSWRFNTLAGGVAPEFHEQGMNLFELLEFRKAGPNFHMGSAWLPDVFDPLWAVGIEALAAQRCPRWRENRELVGYFTDASLGWAPLRASAETLSLNIPSLSGKFKPAQPSLLQVCLSLEPSFTVYHAAWEFVLAPRQGDLSSLARDWAIVLPNKETLRQWTYEETPLTSPGYVRDHERFSREFARRYFTASAAAIRRHDPNHLVLGCYFEEMPGAGILAACAYPQIDAVAVTYDRPKLNEYLKSYYVNGRMPLYLAEYSWTSEAFLRPAAKADPRGLTTIERMLGRGRAACERAFRHPALLGYAWSRWVDTDDDRPPFGTGLVHLDDTEAREHTELLSNINARAEDLHRTARR